MQTSLPRGPRPSPSKRKKVDTDDGTLVFLSIVLSSMRNTARARARIKACELILEFGEHVTDEAKLDRCLPYLMSLLNDTSVLVCVTAIRAITELVCGSQILLCSVRILII